jgi:carboxypeptidase Q
MLEPYGLTDFSQEGGGADIGPLGPLGVPLFGYLPDSQRYFDYHHTQEDTIDKVNKRELELGAAAMAALTYLIDSSGLK